MKKIALVAAALITTLAAHAQFESDKKYYLNNMEIRQNF